MLGSPGMLYAEFLENFSSLYLDVSIRAKIPFLSLHYPTMIRKNDSQNIFLYLITEEWMEQ
jgi:hypothetical protein